jgi:hypothetical protein
LFFFFFVILFFFRPFKGDKAANEQLPAMSVLKFSGGEGEKKGLRGRGKEKNV